MTSATFDYTVQFRPEAEALGLLIRNIALLESEHRSLIGFSINNLTEFETLPQSTTMVSDVLRNLLLAGLTLKDEVVENETNVDFYPSASDPVIYHIRKKFTASSVNTQELAELVDIRNNVTLYELAAPQDVTLDLFFADIDSQHDNKYTEDMLRSTLEQAFSNIISLPVNNRPNVQMKYKVEQFRDAYIVSITFFGPECDSVLSVVKRKMEQIFTDTMSTQLRKELPANPAQQQSRAELTESFT